MENDECDTGSEAEADAQDKTIGKGAKDGFESR